MILDSAVKIKFENRPTKTKQQRNTLSMNFVVTSQLSRKIVEECDLCVIADGDCDFFAN